MKHTQQYLSLTIIAFSVVFSFTLIQSATAQNISNVQYPVEELDNCKNKAACKTYCDKPDNIQACIAFAKKNKLMSTREVETAEKFIAAGAKGPGGCRGKEECKTFCDDISHINECVAFAEKNGLMPAQELEEAKKIQSAIQRGVKPPACKNKKSCDAYCSQVDHMEECMTFAEAAGFMKEKELVEAKKVLSAIKSGIKPPACRGKEECDVYCSEESHVEECIAFAEAAGFMKPEEVQMARKTGGKGPGGCRGKEECDAFCGNQTNQETCFNFAKEYGLVKEGDLKRMEEGKQQMMQGFNQAPPEVQQCLNEALGSERIEKLKNGTAMPSMEIGDTMQKCFESAMRSQEGQMQQDDFRREEFKGQGGEPRQGQGEGQMPFVERPMINANQMPSEVARCLKDSTGEDVAEQIKTGTFRPTPEIEGKMRSCFEQYGQQQRTPQQLPVRNYESFSTSGQMIPEGIRKEEYKELMIPIQEQQRMMGPGGWKGSRYTRRVFKHTRQKGKCPPLIISSISRCRASK